MKNLRLYIVNIHRNFYQNGFINERARNRKMQKSRSFLVMYRRNYALNNKMKDTYKQLLLEKDKNHRTEIKDYFY